MKAFTLYTATLLAFAANITISFAQSNNVSKDTSAYVAQTFRKPILYLGFGAHAIKGSLEEKYIKYLPTLEVGVRLEKRRSRSWGFHFSTGRLISDNFDYVVPERYANTQPATFVRTNYFSLNVAQNISLLRYDRFSLHASVGFGIIRFNTFDHQDRALKNNFRSRAPGEDFSPTAVILPIHITAQYEFTGGLGIAIQAGWLNTQTKGLDNMNILGKQQRNDNVGGFRFILRLPLKPESGHQNT